MGRYSAGMTAAGAGTTARPIFGLVGSATLTGVLREVGLFNTTAVACTYRLVNFTGGTPGTGQTERKHRRFAPAAEMAASGLWTADATVGEDTGYRMVLNGQIGAGAILTFGDTGLESEAAANSGLGLVPVGTGQVCEVYFVWDE